MVLEDEEIAHRRRAIAAGADDYVIGPLTVEKILERLGGYLATLPRPDPPQIALTDLKINEPARCLYWKDKLIKLKPIQFSLICFFLRNPNVVWDRKALIAAVGKAEQETDERNVDRWVARLREGLAAAGAPDPIRTVKAAGYILDDIRHGRELSQD